ncbi:MAG: hypothetical protein WC516_09570 [Patescibacteria group bacterium]|jgi:hypothetical protein
MNCDEAKKELERVYSGLNLSFVVLSIQGRTKDGWEHIHFDCVFKKDNYELKCEYSMGTGLFKLDKSKHFLNQEQIPMYEKMMEKPHANFIDKKMHLSIVQKIVEKTKQYPSDYEVLGSLCRDGYDAHEYSFEDWCSNYGLNSDSIKDKKVYDTCLDYYFKLERLIGRDLIYTFYELMNEL